MEEGEGDCPEAIARANLSAQAHSLTELGVLALLLVSALTAIEKEPPFAGSFERTRKGSKKTGAITRNGFRVPFT